MQVDPNIEGWSSRELVHSLINQKKSFTCGTKRRQQKNYS